MKHLKKFKSELENNKNVKNIKESTGGIEGDLEKYQKLFDEAYAKGDRKSCAKYDKIMVELYKQM
jgi:hypothetical protein